MGILRENIITMHLPKQYRVSTSPKPFAFTNEDGTLIPPDTYSHVRLKEALEKQAEISFKAGVQEVVENLKKTFEYCDSAGDNFTGIGFFISEDDWQKKLKDWGLDGIKKGGGIR